MFIKILYVLNKNKNLGLWLILAVLIISVANIFKNSDDSNIQDVAFSDFTSETQKGNISSVVIKGSSVRGILKNGQKFATTVPYQDNELIKRLLENKIHVRASYNNDSSLTTFIHLILSSLPSLLILGMMFYSIRQMQGSAGKAMGFGKSKARLVNDEKAKNVTFKNVAGLKEAKYDLSEIVDFLKNKQKFTSLGARIPKGVLLSGPPGTGKTLLAKSVAGEAGVPFFSISGSDFIEMFAGVGASRIRDMFDQGKKHSPCIIFIDEIDAIGKKRGGGIGGGCEEREQTLNQLLVEMDGFSPNDGVIILAATNRINTLDKALLRSGRFDRQVSLSLPTLEERKEILELHIQKVRYSNEIDINAIAKGTPGFSGADLSNLINEAALLTGRYNKTEISMNEFESAKDKILMGSERRSLKITEEDKKRTAYHEAGHALVAFHSPNSDPIHKVTIIPRGHSLGMVVRLPENDQVSITKAKLLDDLSVSMGGLAAEKKIFGEKYVTTGASSDIQMATNIARNMVTKWGMGSAGYVHYNYNDNEYRNSTSQSMYEHIDKEVKFIISDAFKEAMSILNKNENKLHELSNILIQKEEMTGEEVKEVLI